eukprot:Ihof_evm1s797 gene=Ihof_evmTU1s797
MSSSEGDSDHMPRQSRGGRRRLINDSGSDGSDTESEKEHSPKKTEVSRRSSSASGSSGSDSEKESVSKKRVMKPSHNFTDSDSDSDSEKEENKPKMVSSRANSMSGSDSEDEERERKKDRRDQEEDKKREGSEDETEDSSEKEKKEEEGESELKKKKKRRRSYEEEMLDDDYDLIEENLGMDRSREIQRNKRLRQGARDESEEEEDDLDMGSDSERQSHRARIRFDDDERGVEEDDLNEFIIDRGEGEGGDEMAGDIVNAYDAMEIFGDGNYDEWMEREDVEQEGFGDYDIDSQEEEDEYGHPVHRPKSNKKNIDDLYEPTVLRQKLMTKEDMAIKAIDVPERFQLSHIQRGDGSVTDEELKEEAQWIYNNAFIGKHIAPSHSSQTHRIPRDGIDPSLPEEAIECINNALKFLRRDHFEVPFISHYRQEYIDHLYNPKKEPTSSGPVLLNYLWHIHDWDAKWDRYYSLRESLLKMHDKILGYQSERIKDGHEVIYPANEDEMRQILRADSQEGLNDWLAYLSARYKYELLKIRTAEEDQEEADDDMTKNLRNTQRRDLHQIALECGLNKLAEKFGLTAKQFGENLAADQMVHRPQDCEQEPLDAAADFVVHQFKEAHIALKGARGILLKDMFYNPVIRREMRKIYRDNCVVSVAPTSRGIAGIDEWHDYAPFKYLKDKPLHNFKREIRGRWRTDTQILLMFKAEAEGFVKVSFDLYESDGPLEQRPIFRNISKLFHSDNSSGATCEHWNEQRDALLKVLLQSFLFPHFEKELRSELNAQAKAVILEEMGGRLKEMINRKPLSLSKEALRQRHNDASDSSDDEDDGRGHDNYIVGIYPGTIERPTFCALVGPYGELVDHIILKNFSMRENLRAVQMGEKDLKHTDNAILQHWIERKRPIAIAMVVDSFDTMNMARDVQRLAEQASAALLLSDPISVEWVDASVPRLFASSARALEEFPESVGPLLQAISTARCLQDPLAELSGMCSYEDEITALNLHPLQDLLSKDERRNILLRQFIDVVNDTGVRINEVYHHKNKQALLQFVAGFGPRKAADVIDKMSEGIVDDMDEDKRTYLASRQELIVNSFMGAKMFENCSGFICIVPGPRTDIKTMPERDEVTRLDATRIHPESYRYAMKMARDALDEEDEDDDNDMNKAVEDIMRHPKKLDDLQLDIYAEELEKKRNIKKGITLYLIKEEFKYPYRDNRPEYRDRRPSVDKKFSMVTGETDETLCPGMMVVAKVQRIKTRPDGSAIGVSVTLSNDMPGTIWIREFSDHKVSDEELESRVEEGGAIECRVVNVDKEKFSVDLSCRSSVLSAKSGKEKDRFYDDMAETTVVDAAKKARRKSRKRPTRAIDHPLYKSFTYQEAEQYLAKMGNGDAVVRPSSSNINNLTLTWRVYDGIYAHINIEEKDRKDPFSLGSRLEIMVGGVAEVYEDLDEIMARYVQPMTDLINEVMGSKYFMKPTSEDEMAAILQQEKTQTPSRIPYHL